MNERILITGATGNVGRACVAEFAPRGWDVVRASRELGLDLADERAVRRWADGVKSLFDIVVMAHGVQETRGLADVDRDVWRRLVDGNLSSAAYLTSALMAWDLVAPGGLVVYCSSIQATQPRKGRAIYAAAKGGLESLMRAAAVEWADVGVRAVALRLGQLTKTMKGVVFDTGQARAVREYTPLPWVDPADVARLVLALYWQKSMTGAVIDLDSGHHLSVWPK